MNQITFKQYKSEYPNYDEAYREIFIDDKPLEAFLDQLYPDHDIKGLVSPFDGWLMNSEDVSLIKERYLPSNGQSSILPILICPDDQDFSCKAIVTKVIAENESIKWENFGLVKSGLNENEIEWFKAPKTFIFNQEHYKKEFEFVLS